MSKTTHDVGIVGLGYVGLTLATALADVGLRVVGIEKRGDVVAMVRSGRPHFRENGLDEILRGVVADGRLEVRADFAPDDCCDAYIITVGTPLGPDGQARVDMIENATRQVAHSMGDDALVILRSTVMIGTSRNVVAPVLMESGRSFRLAMCPERTLEGKAMEELRHNPQIVGADDEETRDRARRLFARLTAKVLPVSSLETAEAIKLADNTYRDVFFAFANEIARMCDVIGISAQEVISTGKFGYPRTNIAMPGLVGGPCLEKDPHILRQSLAPYGVEMEITAASRLVNERQPRECAEFIAAEIAARGAAEDCPVAILGLAFKGIPETDDLRGAMSLKVIRELRSLRPHAPLRVYDPVVEPAAIEALDLDLAICPDVASALNAACAAVITNNHPLFATLGFSALTRELAPGGFVYDFWNHYSDIAMDDRAATYYAVGSRRRVPA
jgi:UDP-N-acetyl-D-mannosaminuronic acid dehydrogenase